MASKPPVPVKPAKSDGDGDGDGVKPATAEYMRLVRHPTTKLACSTTNDRCTCAGKRTEASFIALGIAISNNWTFPGDDSAVDTRVKAKASMLTLLRSVVPPC